MLRSSASRHYAVLKVDGDQLNFPDEETKMKVKARSMIRARRP